MYRKKRIKFNKVKNNNNKNSKKSDNRQNLIDKDQKK
jgi:hypothetical protein